MGRSPRGIGAAPCGASTSVRYRRIASSIMWVGISQVVRVVVVTIGVAGNFVLGLLIARHAVAVEGDG